MRVSAMRCEAEVRPLARVASCVDAVRRVSDDAEGGGREVAMLGGSSRTSLRMRASRAWSSLEAR